MKKIICLALVLVLLFSLGIGAFAADQRIEPKELYYREISIFVNGVELVPQDVNGDSTEPFIIEGTTYLPVRALAGALGLSVGWDGTTNTITLTSGAEVNMGSGEAAKTKEIVKADVYYKNVKIYLDGAELIPTDVTGKYVEPFLMGGSTYLPLRAIASALGLEVGWDEKTNTITLDAPEEEETEQEMVWRLVKENTTVYTQLLPEIGGNKQDVAIMDIVAEYLYNERGQFLAMSRNFASSPVMDVKCSYAYDGKLETISLNRGGKELVLTINYTFYYREFSGIRATMNGEFLAESQFAFDDQGRLINEVPRDAEGNVKEFIFYSYDDNGNCISIETFSDGRITHSVNREYDYEGRLIRELVTDLGNIVSSTSYRYDANGNLISYVHVDKDLEISINTSYDEQGREISSHMTENGVKTTSKTVWSEDGLSCVITTTGDTSSKETLVWNEEGLLIHREYVQETNTNVTEYEYELLPVNEQDELIDALLELMGYSRHK